LVLAEVYENPSAFANPAGARLRNLAVRAYSGGGAAQLTVGFVVRGKGTQPVLIRAVGPGLKRFGVDGTMAAPQLNVSGTLAGSNVVQSFSRVQQWDRRAGSSDVINAAGTLVGAFPLVPGDRDAAAVIFLPAGNYTLAASDEDGGTGIALLEVYAL
ncbi:MAG: hypothetical protein JNL39_14165, partial [Opitutaceae bacterium]|nr:hypothetical protein [Opitutaceae bacterium]